jgi:hypothetical protein
MGRGQKEQLDREVRKFRRRRLVKYHDLEQDLLREVKWQIFLVMIVLVALE